MNARGAGRLTGLVHRSTRPGVYNFVYGDEIRQQRLNRHSRLMIPVLQQLAPGNYDRMDANHVRDSFFVETPLIVLAHANQLAGELCMKPRFVGR